MDFLRGAGSGPELHDAFGAYGTGEGFDPWIRHRKRRVLDPEPYGRFSNNKAAFVRQALDQLCRSARRRRAKSQRLNRGIVSMQQNGNRFGFINRKPGEPGPVVEPQLNAAAASLMDDDRQSGLGHGIHIAQDRPGRAFEFLRKVRRRCPSSVLKDQKDP